MEIARDALAEMPEKEWRPAVQKVEAFQQKMKEPSVKFEAGTWKQVNEEIGKFRMRVTGSAAGR
ncbi:MAG: hypothetical protein EBS49_04200 [Verrucomicrobia bacterium]|nr:hypothetical protein [Verrucomicrobiota bacterium]